jgi:hypothetical protein
MFQKRDDYQRAGVVEYIVLCVEEQQLHWFRLQAGGLILPNRQGISRSQVFPGLWLNIQAVLAHDSARLIEVVQQGLASPEHACFVKRLEKAHRQKRSG